MGKTIFTLLICLSLILPMRTNMTFAEENYNPNEITYPTFLDKSFQERIRKEIDKIIEEYDGKIYVKTYNNFDEIKNHIVEDPGAIFYDPEVSSKRVQLLMAYRIGDSVDEFQAILIDEENYNPDEITYPTFLDKSFQERIRKEIDKIIEEYDGKIYVKTYNNFDEIKNHIVEDPGAIFYDPEVSNKRIQLLMAYRISSSADEFQAILIDYVDS